MKGKHEPGIPWVWYVLNGKLVPPNWGSTAFLISEEELNGKLIGAENGTGRVLLGTTGNKGWDTVTAGVAVDVPGGGVAGEMGSLTFCTGNKGCWGKPTGATETGCGGYQSCGRGGTGQPAGGIRG